MGKEWLARQSTLIGQENTDKLISSSVTVFGIGGVGGYCCEALALRCTGFSSCVAQIQ